MAKALVSDELWEMLQPHDAVDGHYRGVAASTGRWAGFSWGAQGPGLLARWTVTLALGAPPTGVSFRSESLSLPEKV